MEKIAGLVLGILEWALELLPKSLGAALDGATNEALSRSDWW